MFFACVGVNPNDGCFLKAEQTFIGKKLKGMIKGLGKTDSLIFWYLRMIEKNSNIIVADACFPKGTFMTGLEIMGFDLISRFRDDLWLNYLYRGE